MKVTNWRRKLAASLVAGGLMTPAAAYAANLDENLVTDPSFEHVGTLSTEYAAVELLDWTDGTQSGFAYHINQGYDTGGPLAGGGNYYFSPNANLEGEPDVTEPGQVSQNIDVTGGETGNQIGIGAAAVKLSAYFTTYTNSGVNDGDLGNLHVEFFNAGGTSLGSTKITAKDPITWHQVTGAAFVPKGTTRLKASVFGTPVSAGPDGYTDLVDVQITDAQNELMFLEVHTDSGDVFFKNLTGDSFHIDYYEIKAPSEVGDFNSNGAVDAADYARWRDNLNGTRTLPNDQSPGTVTSTDYNDWKANFGSGNVLDASDWNVGLTPTGNGSGNGWEKAGGSDAEVLSASFLTGNSVVANNANIDLGSIFNVGSPEDLEFFYSVVPDNGVGQFVGPGVLTQGFVRFVNGGGAAAAVPEPSSILLVGIGLASVAVGLRKSNRDSNA